MLSYRLSSDWPDKGVSVPYSTFPYRKDKEAVPLAVGRKRTEMLCISVLGVESMFGMTLCFSVIRDRTKQSHRMICVHLHGHVWPKF